MADTVFTAQNVRQAMYKSRNIKERLCNHFCSLKAISITCYECAFLALGTRHARSMHHIVVCNLPGSAVFVHIISQTEILKNK